MLKPSLSVILKGIYRYRYIFTYEYRWGQRSLNLKSKSGKMFVNLFIYVYYEF